MEKGKSSTTSFLERCLTDEIKLDIDCFLKDSDEREFLSFSSLEQVNNVFGALADSFNLSLNEEDKSTIKTYTGIGYKEINAIARDNWNYEINGRKTAELEQYYKNVTDVMERVIHKFPSLGLDIKVYRGAFLKQFFEYGIRSLDDLEAMQGKFFYDAGFTSTSLCRDDSLLGVSAFLSGERNVEIEYLVPSECQDGILLMGEEGSYYSSENEFLFNRDSLAKITNVEIDKENNKAFMRAVLIPRTLWDPYAYKKINGDSKST